MTRKTVFLSLCFLALCAATKPSEDNAWLSPVLGEGYGVQIKEWRTGATDLDKMKAAGLTYVRFVIPWYAVEKSKDVFVWREFDPILSLLREKKMKAVIVLGGGHPAYTRKVEPPKDNPDHVDEALAAPSTPEEIEAFARYAARTVKRYGREGLVWEIWNEPDLERFWAPKPDAGNYARLAQAACRAIRDVAPSARIVGTGSADMPGRYGTIHPGFVGRVLRSSAFDCFDALSLHAYRDGETPPETVLTAHEKLGDFLKTFTPKKREIPPVLVTEWGFSLTEVSPEEQAAFLLRSFLLNSLSGVPISIWYEWRDSRRGEDHEAHYGLLDYAGKEKPSYKALQDFLPQVKGARIEKRIDVGDEEAFVLSLRFPEGRAALVFWTSREDQKKALFLKAGPNEEEKEEELTALPQIFLCETVCPVVSLTKGEAP